MAAIQIVFRTAGFAKAYVSTTGSIPFALTSAAKVAFFNTTANNPIVLTSNKKSAFFQTTDVWPIVKTSGAAVTFVVTPNPNTPKELVLKIGTLEFTANSTIVNVPDATGAYESTTNPGGYNVLPSPYNEYRPYRDNVSLWTAYKIWDVYGDETQTPSAQAEAHDVPYLYPLSFPTTENALGEDVVIKGIYEIILIAAPYFNQSDSGGTYLSESLSEETYYILTGTDTNFSDVLIPGDYLYCIDQSNGDLLEIEEVLHLFDNTSVALLGAAINTPSEGAILYGSNTQITTTVNSGGVADTFTSGEYTPITGTGTSFDTLSQGDVLFYIDATTGDYKAMGTMFNIVNPLTINLTSLTENVASGGEILVAYPSDEVPVINSLGTYDTSSSVLVNGTNTQFTLFTPGQTLYYQEVATGQLVNVGVIDYIVSDIELAVVGGLTNIPTFGDRLFASDSPALGVSVSGGVFDAYYPVGTYYTLTGTGTSFGAFNSGDYVYVVRDSVYYNLGQISFVQDSTNIVFYSPNDVAVVQGDYIIASSVQLSLIDISGTALAYQTGGYYNVEGAGTTFLTTASNEQYLFYLDAATNKYVLMGQIFKVYDDTNVWLYEAPSGGVALGDALYSSDSLNTETADYNDYIGNINLYDIAKELPSWYVTSVGIMVDDDVVNCLTRMRYEFLQQVMCGKCPDKYLSAYSNYVGMLNAMEIQDWPTAIDFYNKLKTQCSEDMNSSCGC